MSRLSLRKAVFQRDRGICAECQADCEKIARVFGLILGTEAQLLYAAKLRISNDQRTFWEADHIEEVAAGGADALANIQTLCIACHLSKTTRFIQTRPCLPRWALCRPGCENISHIDSLLALARSREVKYFPTDGRMRYLGPPEGLDLFRRELLDPLRRHDAAIVTLISDIRAADYDVATVQ